jgi:purine-nucleoside phosphorylase
LHKDGKKQEVIQGSIWQMRFYSIALLSEAKPIIEKFSLVKNGDFFENDEVKLIVSGMGVVNSAIATTYLLTKFDAKKDDMIFNIGIAGANFKCDIGDSFLVSKVIDFHSRSILTLPHQGKKLTTVSTPATKIDIKNTLVDMESYGFLKASKKFIKDENIFIQKVVSDFLDDSVPSKEKVYNLIKNMI